jgi:hypothetical protein
MQRREGGRANPVQLASAGAFIVYEFVPFHPPLEISPE